jgi:hypothetical protein
MPRAASLFLLCFLTPAIASASVDWKETTWHGERAWRSESGAVVAIVSERRSRLIHFGPADALNLLSAPPVAAAPTEEQISPNWGGHRFWLGPQSRWNWPPPTDWEFARAASVTSEQGVLRLAHPQTSTAYPAMVREYRWEADKLRCTVKWRGGDKPFYAMHVFAVNVPTSIRAKLYRWDRVPHGTVGIVGDTPNAPTALPHPAASVVGDSLEIKSGIAVAKLGFFPQPLTISTGGWSLTVHPGVHRGIAIESPDFGYLTQVWVGRESATFAELEQLSPYLLPDNDGWCESTVWVQAARTKDYIGSR